METRFGYWKGLRIGVDEVRAHQPELPHSPTTHHHLMGSRELPAAMEAEKDKNSALKNLC